MTPVCSRIVIYTKRPDEMAGFYGSLFGYTRHQDTGDRFVELRPPGAGLTILLHPAARSQKEGQALVKPVFDIADVDGFCAWAAARGIAFGPVHHADGYAFANVKDPSKNSVSVSSRAFR